MSCPSIKTCPRPEVQTSSGLACKSGKCYSDVSDNHKKSAIFQLCSYKCKNHNQMIIQESTNMKPSLSVTLTCNTEGQWKADSRDIKFKCDCKFKQIFCKILTSMSLCNPQILGKRSVTRALFSSEPCQKHSMMLLIPAWLPEEDCSNLRVSLS